MEPRIGNKYRLGRKIGSGSFGEIYLGEQTCLFLESFSGCPGQSSLFAMHNSGKQFGSVTCGRSVVSFCLVVQLLKECLFLCLLIFVLISYFIIVNILLQVQTSRQMRKWE